MNRNIVNFAPFSMVLAVMLLGSGLTGCGSAREPAPAAQETVNNVAVIVAHKSVVPEWIEAVGTVRANRTSQLASQMMGTILDVRAQEGQRVQSGQVLATIDAAQPRAAVEQAVAAVSAAQKEVSAADANLALATSTLKRYQQLYDRKSVSPQEFDEIKTRQQSAEARRDQARAGQTRAEAELAQARTSLGYAQIRAPFSGLITERKADPGTLAAPGQIIFTLEDTRSYRLEAAVNENDIENIHVGEAARVTLDALGNTELAGTVSQIVPAADADSRSFLVKISLPEDARFRSGMFGRARFAHGTHTQVMIPRSAVVVRGQLQGVYVIDAGQTASLRYITLGNPAGQQVEVLSGLQEGEKLVAEPGERELGGMKIVARQ